MKAIINRLCSPLYKAKGDGRPVAAIAAIALLAAAGSTAGCDKKEEAAPAPTTKGVTKANGPGTPADKATPPPVAGTVGEKPAPAVAPATPSPASPTQAATKPAPKVAVHAPTAKPKPAPVEATPTPAEVPGSNTLEVRDLKLAAGVEQRMPWGIGSTFPTGARKVVAWVRVRNKGEKSFITMVWTKGGAEVHRAKLDVGKSTGWRTWSKKRLSKGDAGTWRVAVVAPNGDELTAKEFTVVEGEVVEPVDAPAAGDKADDSKKVADKKPAAACRSLVVVGGAKGVATVDVRGGGAPSMRARRGVVGYQGRRAYALRVVNVHDELGSTTRNWQELWSLELPDGKPSKRFGDAQSAKVRIDAVAPGVVSVRVVDGKGKATSKTLAVGGGAADKVTAKRPKAGKDGWVSLGEGCGSVRPSVDGLEYRASATATPTKAKLPIGSATTVLGLTPLATYARFDLRWMFNQKIHADTLMRKGRKQSREGNFGAAIATFQEALAFKPSDSTLAGELAWAFLRKGDLTKAEAWGNKARRWARTDRNRASARYNLGRVAEAAGKKTLAIQHYEASLAKRKSAAVAARIAALRGAAPKAP